MLSVCRQVVSQMDRNGKGIIVQSGQVEAVSRDVTFSN